MADFSGDAFDAYDQWDEDDIRVRPNPKGSRPRTKQRPAHDDAVRGMVVTVDRGRYTVLLDEGIDDERHVTAKKAREIGRKPIVTGDLVDLVGDATGEPGTLARIVRIGERATLLRRSADDTDQVERVIVANADQMLIVAATAQPEPRPRLIDRYLVAALDAGIRPLLVLTKTDVAPADAMRALVEPLGVPVFESSPDSVPLEALRLALAGHTTVAVGHSGVGKSTLVNALVPEAARETGVVNAVTGRGRHTSSSTLAVRVEAGNLGSGWIIDTPGVRSFGLGHVDRGNLLSGFAELAEIAEDCPRGCTHRADAPDCALDEAADRGAIDEAGLRRLDSLRRLFASLDQSDEATP